MKANLTDSVKSKVRYMGSEKVFSFNEKGAEGAHIAYPRKLEVQKGQTTPIDFDYKTAKFQKAEWKQAGAK